MSPQAAEVGRRLTSSRMPVFSLVTQRETLNTGGDEFSGSADTGRSETCEREQCCVFALGGQLLY